MRKGDGTAPPCKHGVAFITLCAICTPPAEKDVELQCDKMMQLLGWRLVKFSQPRRTMQAFGIPDRRYYPPKGNIARAVHWKPFWFEVKKKGGKQRPDQKLFEEMCVENEEHYVWGDLAALAVHLRQQKIAEIGIR